MGFNLLVSLVAVIILGLSSTNLYAKGPGAKEVALAYAEAMAKGEVTRWAALDLGCLMRTKGQPQGSDKGQKRADLQQACWNDTLQAHRKMAEQDAQTGVFSSSSLDGNFGLLHERHRVAATWREYPPAIFVSPSVAHMGSGPAPRIHVEKTTPTQPVPLVRLKGDKTVTVPGIGVDIKILYDDPITAPLALSPDEPAWAKGVTRKFGPVREVTARFIVVSGLRKAGLPSDVAVLNEALPDAPGIPYAHYGMNPDPGRPWVRPGSDLEQPPLIGGLVNGSAA